MTKMPIKLQGCSPKTISLWLQFWSTGVIFISLFSPENMLSDNVFRFSLTLLSCQRRPTLAEICHFFKILVRNLNVTENLKTLSESTFSGLNNEIKITTVLQN